jgi:HlyD family secretion protein
VKNTQRNAVGRRAIAGALAVLALTACNGTSASENESGGIELAQVTRGDLTVTAEAAGLVEPIRIIEVKSRASGEIMEILVETGDVVQPGQLLVRIDPRDVRNAFEQAEADLEVARARLTTAEAQRKRSAELREANVVTEQEYESATFEEANARAQHIKAQTNLQLARERLNDVVIRAPIAGTVIAETIEIGQIIASASQNISGGTTLLTMADLNEMQVRALVDETDLGRIQPGLGVRVRVEAYPDRVFNGQVLKIEPQAVVEQNVTMFPVLVRLDNREGLLRPGMNADVEVRIADRTGTLLVPNSAVVSPRDVIAAAEVLGLDAEAVRAQVRGGNGGAGGPQVAMAQPGGAPGSPQQSAAQPAGTRGDNGVTPAAPAGATADAEECRGLAAKMRSAGGVQGLSEGERAQLRNCRAQFGRGAQAEPTGPGSAGDVRPGIVFVSNNGTIEPRRVTLGVNDWDNTEVISGLEEGDQVVLMSVARLQAQQQQFQDRIRERTSGPFPGGGGRR